MEPTSFASSTMQLIQERVLRLWLPEDAALSLPMARKAGSDLADAFFLYQEEPGHIRPFAWAVLDAASGQPLTFSRCEFLDFTPEGAYPLSMALEPTLPQPLTGLQVTDGRRELTVLYERLRDFAFSPSPTREQQEVMERFARLFEMLAYVDHYPFYRALSPEFLQWLGLELSGGPAPAISMEKLSETIAATADAENGVAAALTNLARLFERKIETDHHRQKIFDVMHAELQEYKNNLIDNLTRPMEGDVIKLIDDIEKSMEVYRSRQFNPDNYRRLFTLFEGVATDLTDLLYRHGVEPFSLEGDEVVVGHQKILATTPTDKPKLDKKVALRHSRGWEKDGKVIRPERVTVYVYTPPEKK